MKSLNFSLSLSIVIPTLNNQDDIELLLKNIKDQDYPENKIEIIIVDGGSTDLTTSTANKYKAKVYNNKKVLAEPGVNLGICKAESELIMILAADNRFYKTNSIAKIISAFDNPKIVAAYPKHDSDKGDTLFSKYINTFTDPFNHFIYGDSSNARTFKNVYKTIYTSSIYDIYDYLSSNTKPMLAFAQGFTFRSGYKRDNSDEYDDVVPIQKIIREGKQIAYIHSVLLVHHTVRNASHFIRKTKWATQNAINSRSYGISHRQNYLTTIQKIKFIVWPFYALFLPFSIIRSMAMILLTGEKIWLFNPVISFLSAYASILAILEVKLKRNINIKRQ